MSIALVSCHRNEGAFLLEWLAYYRVIGFGRILVATNNLTDGSDHLLDALDAAGALTHLPHSPAVGERPQDSGMATALAHLAADPPDWVLHCDADEFLNLREGTTLSDLEALGRSAHCIALPWRLFGDSGHATWPGATLPHFTRTSPGLDPEHTKFKAMFRPSAFAHARDHMPERPRIADPVLIAANGMRLNSTFFHTDKHHSRVHPMEIALAPGLAVMNHYAVRSTDLFEARAIRGRGQNGETTKYRLGSRWYRTANRNEVEERSILRHWPAVVAEMSRLTALPGVASALSRIGSPHDT